VAKAIEQHKLDLLPASPSFINLFLISGVISKYDLTSLKWITYGAETMPESTLKRLNQLLPQIKLKQTYGLIEIGVLATKSESDSSTLIKLGGKGYEIRVIDQQLEIKAESSMLGYLNAESPFTEDGFFKTGDYVEEHGEWIKILGRKSNLIFTAGEKVHPSEVESVILECEGVDDVLVFGKPNPLLGNIVSAIVKIGSSLDKEKVKKEILNNCRSKLSRIKVPMSIEFTYEDLFTMRLKKERR
jgi:acyl-CoA synthetase (AMP-forming)/AMP-acid ligase II